MTRERPQEGEAVQVKLNDGDWQPATYREGQFIDLYGLPLDSRKITRWQHAERSSLPPAARGGATRRLATLDSR